jgi:hypothetical protein
MKSHGKMKRREENDGRSLIELASLRNVFLY